MFSRAVRVRYLADMVSYRATNCLYQATYALRAGSLMVMRPSLPSLYIPTGGSESMESASTTRRFFSGSASGGIASSRSFFLEWIYKNLPRNPPSMSPAFIDSTNQSLVVADNIETHGLSTVNVPVFRAIVISFESNSSVKKLLADAM